MRLTIDLSGSQHPQDDLDQLAAITSSLADLLSEARDPPGEGVALTLALVSTLIKGIAAELPRPCAR